MESTAAERIVVVGDLNAAADALWEILLGTGLVDGRGHWAGGRAELVQLGDVFNRGAGARAAFELMLRLQREARAAGGRVTMLLGNHEVMTTLGNEAYCTEGEYLSFATAREQAGWPERVRRAALRLYREHPARGPVPPLMPRLELWKVRNVPGRVAMRRALAPTARLGRAVRKLPVVALRDGIVFAHAGILPVWAALGIDGLNRAAREEWTQAGRYHDSLPRNGVLRAEHGPLWDRTLTMEVGLAPERALARSLQLLGARRMVVGHTSTGHVPGGTRGHIMTRFGGRLVCADVGLASGPDAPRAALWIEGGRGYEWTPSGTRTLWDEAKSERREP